ncbi:MAG: ATP synthase F1 subunit delta [Acidobacteriales bacterium]|nr:ATP synthase F1 subunit delta [Terriglobales bacterium]
MAQVVASRYAKALADLVVRPGSGLYPATVSAQLKTFSETLKSSADLRAILLSPAVATVRKHEAVSRILSEEHISELVHNFLFVIIGHRRISMLDAIAEAFQDTIDERMGVVKAAVSSARPLDEKQKSAVAEELERLTGQKVRCEFAADPALVGGVAAKIGSRVYDGSVRGELSALRRRLVQ